MFHEKHLNIPETLVKNIISLHGDRGKKFIDCLPEFILNYENKWKLKVGECFSDAQFNIVFTALKNNGTSAVFKCCVPNKEFKTEVKSLKHYNGFGAVKLLESDVENGAMLIEKINPGILLEQCNFSIENKIKYTIYVCKKLHKPYQSSLAANSIGQTHNSFPTLQDWFLGLDRALLKKFNSAGGPCSKTTIEKARSLSRELLQSQSTVVLLHGDLHYANLLQSGNQEFIAIDPKGVIGEPEFEIPLPRVTYPITTDELFYHLDCFIEQSQFDKKRIDAWLFSKAVLSAWWTVEDSGAPHVLTQKLLSVAEKMNSRI